MNLTKQLRGIKDDIKRTIKGDLYFQPHNKGFKKMYQVLKAFTLYDQNWGYVQGMNFIVAALAYHCDANTAFWLWISLIEDYHLRKNYVEGFEGMYQRCNKIAEMLKLYDEKMYEFMEIHCVDIQMIALEAIMSLFFNMVPLEKSQKHLSAFFENGWNYFYALFLQFIKQISSEIYKCKDQYEILSIFKDHYHNRSPDPTSLESKMLSWTTLAPFLNQKPKFNWDVMISQAVKVAKSYK